VIPRVLVTEGEERSVLAACRGLRAAGYHVDVAASTPTAPAQWSRSCDRRIETPDPRAGRALFVAALERVLGDHDYGVVLPGTEASLLAVSEHRDRLEPLARFGLPAPGVVTRSLDKIAFLDAAASAGLRPPESQVCEGPDRADEFAARLGYPLVVKAARSFLDSADGLRQQRTVVAVDSDALARAAGAFEGPIILQRYIAGRTLLSFAGVMLDRVYGATCARYVRTWPVDAGPSCFSETIPVSRSLRQRVETLLEVIGWRGIFQLQLVESAGRLAAIDLNPRVFGSLALPIGAGANLPAIWCDSVVGRPVNDADARVGARYRWEDGDAKHLVFQASRGELRAAASVLRPRRRVVHAYFRLEDPRPFGARLAGMLLGRLAGRLRFARARARRARARSARDG
jgi:predicted ATP-grasp superfamily ATP-dependent carboligase